MFLLTHVEKCVTVDHYETGCEMERRCVMAENAAIRAETIQALTRKISERYGVELDDIWVGAIDEGRISFNRTENADGNPPSEAELAKWKLDKLTLWIADYDFCVDKYNPQPLTMADFAGMKTHE